MNLIIFFLATVVGAEDTRPPSVKPRPPLITEENIGPYLARQQAETSKRLRAAHRGRITRVANSNVVYNEKSGRYSFRSPADRDGEVKRLEGELVKPRMPLIWARPQEPIEQEQIGGLFQRYTTYRVVQVVDANNAIMHATANVTGAGPPVAPHEWSFWLRSPEVATFRDGKEFKTLPGAFKVVGTKTYTTAAGASRTIDLLEYVDLSKYTKAPSADPGYPNSEREERPTYRTWHAAEGDFSVEAVFIKVSAGQVTLRKPDGAEITLPMDRLSEADQEWIRKPHTRE